MTLAVATPAHRPARSTYLVALAVLAALCALPLLAPGNYVLSIATLGLFFAVASTGLNIVYGYAGLLSFAQVGFWGLGAYTSALVSMDLGLSPWLGIVAAGLVCGVAAVIGGFAALRVSRDAFVIVTLSFSLLLQLLARNWISLTRGPMGIPGLPKPALTIPGIGTLDGADPAGFYWITLIFAVVIIAVAYRLIHSRIGRAFVAVNIDEALASSQGIPVFRTQLAAFCASAVIGGLAGGLYVFHLGIVDPGIFDMYYAQMMLMIVIVGGAGYFWPVLAMTAVFTILPELLRLAPELRLVLFGLILVATIQFLPQGLGGYLHDIRVRRLRGIAT
ncbi:branched-chain amino acid ABC transporter permease (plasmid) [Aminobacter sp. SR38]|uniref:branched-chain amino acid ABC transporter permease n=1 Tax=Aminobacter sp. SR38 TaxID=2774562 RepID=UPI0017841F7E|nr:branched-chain amino acid ABC transporter permease [Aminobacter sp. SR38]QOF75701.1 branched-chain amino acid ABC transporter permease [Aminobacter sp. SR38]